MGPGRQPSQRLWLAVALTLWCNGSPLLAATQPLVWLYFKDGTTLAVVSDWTIKGNTITARTSEGRLVSVRLSELDLEASQAKRPAIDPDAPKLITGQGAVPLTGEEKFSSPPVDVGAYALKHGVQRKPGEPSLFHSPDAEAKKSPQPTPVPSPPEPPSEVSTSSQPPPTRDDGPAPAPLRGSKQEQSASVSPPSALIGGIAAAAAPLALFVAVALLLAARHDRARKARMMTVSLNPAEYQGLSEAGNGVIDGQAFLRQMGGGVVRAAGEFVTLDPVTSYSEAWWEKFGRPGVAFELVEFPATFLAARRTTQADVDGKFRFAGVPAGQYFIRTRIFWTNGPATQGGTVGRLIEVAEGLELAVILSA